MHEDFFQLLEKDHNQVKDILEKLLIERGIFVQKELPEYCDRYKKIMQRAQAA